MKKLMTIFGSIILASVLFSSCTSINKTMREPNVRVDFTKNDFTLSEQVNAEGRTTKIFNIDFARLFTKRTGNVGGGSSRISFASLPVIGNLMFDKTSNYALYELMDKNPGYDVIFYPQYEVKVVKPILGLGFIAKRTTVKTTARLGKLNK
jgi:hypothetical protein